MPHNTDRYHFRGQQTGETVLRVIHRHWFNLLTHLFLILVFAFLILGSVLTFPLLFPELLDPLNTRLFLFVENTLFLFLWLFGFLVWIDYYFDVWIITDQRIVNIEQKGLFVRHTSELNFSRIQDVTTEVDGLIATILDFGDVLIQTAGEESRFIFRQVGNPAAVKDLVMKLSKGALDDDLRKVIQALGHRDQVS